MNALDNHGIIIRELRRLRKQNLQLTANIISRSVGWLSEIENGTGACRLTSEEFDQIVSALDGEQYRPLFKTWTANHKNQERVDRIFEGAVLKYVRVKKGVRLGKAARMIGITPSYLSRLENGIKPMTLEIRTQIMKAYGYNPSSFKNLSTDPVRSKAVSPLFKLKILLRTFTTEQIEQVFQAALAQIR